MQPIVIGITGGSGSGKTTLAKKIQSYLGAKSSIIIAQDSYYFDQSKKFDGDGGSVNFDHPSSLDFDLLAQHILQIKDSKAIQVPQYDFKTHSRLREALTVEPRDLVIVDGTLILSQKNIRENLDVSIFVDIPEDVRFLRRLRRDVKERGRTEDGVRKQFFSQVKPMHDEFVEPSKQYANFIANDFFDIEAFAMKAKLHT